MNMRPWRESEILAWTLAQRGCSLGLCGARMDQQATVYARAGSIQRTPESQLEISEAVSRYRGV